MGHKIQYLLDYRQRRYGLYVHHSIIDELILSKPFEKNRDNTRRTAFKWELFQFLLIISYGWL